MPEATTRMDRRGSRVTPFHGRKEGMREFCPSNEGRKRVRYSHSLGGLKGGDIVILERDMVE